MKQLIVSLVAFSAIAASAAPTPWADPTIDAERRTNLLLRAMKPEDKLRLVFGYFSSTTGGHSPPKGGRPFSAGFIPGLPEYGIPNQWQTDAGVGVATQGSSPHPRERTALPSGIATAATWNRRIAYAGGKMIGEEARLSGFNVQLAGGVNLLREPRNGRKFEYAGEDPLLAGTMVGEQIRGIQSNHIVSTIKHFAFNDQETARSEVNVLIDDQAARMSDLLAFQYGLELGTPGSVMCSYNRVNGHHACENEWLLNEVLKHDWKYQGYVMSDWGAVHSTADAANAGLDQESGYPFDDQPYFGEPLADAITNGTVPQERLDDMATRILRPMFTTGLYDDPVTDEHEEQIDFAAHARVSQADAEESIVLLKNENSLLPLSAKLGKIAIIGGHADVGVLSGGGSSQVYPRGGSPVPNEGPVYFPGPIVFYPSSPLRNLRSQLSARGSAATIVFNDGRNLAAARKLAERSDVVIVFATQWTGESFDAESLTLPHRQDALIEAVARVNPKVIVVLETGGPVRMPWLGHVRSVVEAWYPGTAGGEAIARVLIGDVNPSGHLPATFPRNESQLPRPQIDQTMADYNIEGAAVGYKWFDRRGLTPLFPFGFGLSYTKFTFADLNFSSDGGYAVRFRVKNSGERAGAAVPQVYVARIGAVSANPALRWEAPQRLVTWEKVSLAPNEEVGVESRIDPRTLAVYDPTEKKWKILAGDYEVRLSTSSRDIAVRQRVHLEAAEFD